MTEPKYFGVRPYPSSNEGFEGYLLRVMLLNGLQDLGDFAKALNISKPTLLGFGRLAESTMHELAVHVAQMLKRDPGVFDGTIARQQARWIFNQHRMIQDLRVDFPRACPCCMEHTQTMDWRWGLALTSSCAVHGMRLLDTCSNCATPFAWDSRLFNGCPSCGISWKQQVSEQSVMTALEQNVYAQLDCGQPSGEVLELLAGAIIAMARPLDAMHLSLQVLPRVSGLAEIVQRAYMLIENERFRETWTRVRASTIPMCSGAVLSWQLQRTLSSLPLQSSVDLRVTADLKTGWCEYPEFVRASRKKCSSVDAESLRHQVGYQELACAMGVSSGDIQPLVASGVLDPLNSTNVLRDQLFDLRQLPSLKRESAHSTRALDLTVTPDSPLFDRYLSTFGDLLAACLRGEIQRYRLLSKFCEIQINERELRDWLWQQLRAACADSIPISHAQRAISCGPQRIRSMVADGAFTWARWSSSGERIDGESFYLFVSKERLEAVQPVNPKDHHFTSRSLLR